MDACVSPRLSYRGRGRRLLHRGSLVGFDESFYGTVYEFKEGEHFAGFAVDDPLDQIDVSEPAS